MSPSHDAFTHRPCKLANKPFTPTWFLPPLYFFSRELFTMEHIIFLGIYLVCCPSASSLDCELHKGKDLYLFWWLLYSWHLKYLTHNRCLVNIWFLINKGSWLCVKHFNIQRLINQSNHSEEIVIFISTAREEAENWGPVVQKYGILKLFKNSVKALL